MKGLKLIYSLTALYLTISLLLSHTNSYSTAQIRNEAALSIASEDRALIAITYRAGNKRFAVTNNTGKTVEIEKVEILSDTDHRIIDLGENNFTAINPGRVNEFTITGDPKSLTGKVIQIIVHWNGGRAEINSTIPETIER